MFSGIDFFVFKQKTAYEMRISDWSSDVCSSDLVMDFADLVRLAGVIEDTLGRRGLAGVDVRHDTEIAIAFERMAACHERFLAGLGEALSARSEEHTSELQSLMRSSYAVFCLKKTKYGQSCCKPDDREVALHKAIAIHSVI